MNMIISPAFANTNATLGFDLTAFLPILLILAVFYFVLLRPQQKKVQQQKEMLANLRRGDRIVTSGGLIGTINKILNEQELEVEIAPNVRVNVARAMVAECLAKTQPVKMEAPKTVVASQPAKKAAVAMPKTVSMPKKAVAKKVAKAASKPSKARPKKAKKAKKK